MHVSIENLLHIQGEIKEKIIDKNFKNYNPEIIAVSKTFKIDHVIHLVNHGHLHFGENKVQEAIEKWNVIKSENSKLKLQRTQRLPELLVFFLANPCLSSCVDKLHKKAMK